MIVAQERCHSFVETVTTILSTSTVQLDKVKKKSLLHAFCSLRYHFPQIIKFATFRSDTSGLSLGFRVYHTVEYTINILLSLYGSVLLSVEIGVVLISMLLNKWDASVIDFNTISFDVD